jgi:metal-responsive CopG/Arc/MetJ family transcriptional regulator
MRTTKTISVSLPPDQLKDMEKTAKRENRTLSELIRKLFRQYQARQKTPVNFELLAAIRAVQTDAVRAGLDKMTMREINAEIAAARRERAKKGTRAKQPAR